MATIRLPADFRDFLRLLNFHRVKYLLYHGYFRTTGDLDLWVAVEPDNARKLVQLIREFGFDVPELNESLFLQKGRIIRMGEPTTRIELLTEISSCEFAECHARRVEAMLDDLPVSLISLPDLVHNKLKAGRLKDLDDARRLS